MNIWITSCDGDTKISKLSEVKFVIYISIYIIIGKTKKNSNQNFKLEFQFCAMSPKLFKKFYFLI